MQIQRKIQQQGPINDDPSRLQYQHAIDNEPKEAQQHNKYNCFFIPSYFPLFFPPYNHTVLLHQFLTNYNKNIRDTNLGTKREISNDTVIFY